MSALLEGLQLRWLSRCRNRVQLEPLPPAYCSYHSVGGVRFLDSAARCQFAIVELTPTRLVLRCDPYTRAGSHHREYELVDPEAVNHLEGELIWLGFLKP